MTLGSSRVRGAEKRARAEGRGLRVNSDSNFGLNRHMYRKGRKEMERGRGGGQVRVLAKVPRAERGRAVAAEPRAGRGVGPEGAARRGRENRVLAMPTLGRTYLRARLVNLKRDAYCKLYCTLKLVTPHAFDARRKSLFILSRFSEGRVAEKSTRNPDRRAGSLPTPKRRVK